MTIMLRKTGEAFTARALKTPKYTQRAFAAASSKSKVDEPRSVNKEEVHLVEPAKESTKETLMPWRGWVGRVLQDKMGDARYKMLRNTFYFMPDDPHNLQQTPMPSTTIKISNNGEEAAFRQTSPGSQPPVRVPLEALDDDPYDSGYFKRDTRRRFVDPEFPHPDIEKLKLDMMDPDDPEVIAAKEKLAAGPTSSPGNKGRFPTGPSDFDSTGLRAVMSVTHKSLNESLDKHMPNHVRSRESS
jgi:hypothetical protein